ncbi:hypothetical protein ElyMa_006698400 [Elysia marginata]|uniref:Uncharacterized protein n=1 Tax=Elysia marginata TaxID=1093978 RepID=A0AAV4IPE8_9GAST|nr:hypothetical protein ElyMa_006698400 [Elysia marginata]
MSAIPLIAYQEMNETKERQYVALLSTTPIAPPILSPQLGPEGHYARLCLQPAFCSVAACPLALALSPSVREDNSVLARPAPRAVQGSLSNILYGAPSGLLGDKNSSPVCPTCF